MESLPEKLEKFTFSDLKYMVEEMLGDVEQIPHPMADELHEKIMDQINENDVPAINALESYNEEEEA